jgi:death-on-curing protein
VSEPIFLTLDEIFRLHTRSLAEHGGSEGVRDRGLVESAMESARNTFYYGQGNVYDIAASYAFHLAEAQAFLDGNKRTAVAAALVFLARNGVYVRPAQLELYFAMIRIAEKKLSKAGLTAIFRGLAADNN